MVSVPSVSALLVSDGGQCQMVIGWYILAPAPGSGFSVSGTCYFPEKKQNSFWIQVYLNSGNYHLRRTRMGSSHRSLGSQRVSRQNPGLSVLPQSHDG